MSFFIYNTKPKIISSAGTAITSEGIEIPASGKLATPVGEGVPDTLWEVPPTEPLPVGVGVALMYTINVVGVGVSDDVGDEEVDVGRGVAVGFWARIVDVGDGVGLELIAEDVMAGVEVANEGVSPGKVGVGVGVSARIGGSG
jgi:hypothetical protein